MYRGRVRFTRPMLCAIGFMVPFVIGCMTGVLQAMPQADFVVHNSLFLVAHFHNAIIGAVLSGAFPDTRTGFRTHSVSCWMSAWARLHSRVGSSPSISLSLSCRCTSWAWKA